MSADLAAPRFPHVAAGAPHYESYFIKACHPTEPRAFWMRHTVHQRPGERKNASIWLTLFDANAAEPVRAGKHTTAELSAPAGGYIDIGGSVVEPGRAEGALASPSLSCAWAFDIDSDEDELRHLPIAKMYDAKVPKTKSITPHPAALLTGELDGERLEGWRGVSSHNWGSEHAERWIYLHCGQFDGRGRDTWLEMTVGRIKVGRVTVPWIANGALQVDGKRMRLGGPHRRTKVRETPTTLHLTSGGLELELSAPKEHYVAWRYADPEGPEHHTAHTSIADLRVRADGVELVARQAATYELGMRETDHGLPVQPYDDGRL